MGMGIKKPFIDSDYDNTATPDSPEIAIQLDSAANQACNTSETPQKVPQNFFPQRTDYVTEQIRIPTWNLMRK